MTNFSKKQIIDFSFAIPAIFGFSGLFLYPDANKELALLIFILFLFSIPCFGYRKIKENVCNRKVSWLFITMSIIALIAKTTHGYSSSELRVLIALSLYSIIIPENTLKLLKKYLPQLTCIGCFVSFFYCFYEAIILNTPRIHWGINPIPYSTFTAAVVISSLWFVFNHPKKSIKIGCTFASVIGVSAILISQTRGTFLALLISLIYLLITSKINKTILLKFISSLFIITFILSYFNFNKIEQRYIQTKIEYTNIINGNLNTSIGNRLQMWHAGFELAKEPTLLGLGNDHIKEKQKLYEEHRIVKEAVPWGHYHNQYITSFIKNGIIGFILLICLFIIPISHARNNKKRKTSCTDLGILVLIIYLVSSLTDIPLTQAVTLAFYGLFMLIVTLGDEATDID
ncbi:O-antigen ligase family protein [Aliivibrio fischeri]|uniref:O-antigen ligase family protein n=1 Tax=Aliivibrio fischeri TaxID=668 RepID=UPI001F3D4143|nr:O-antigen ligase family protein [Aliivibrio fischeri]MCE7566336.1 O-antigen ligase family protein [Aliivibrio fischeri]